MTTRRNILHLLGLGFLAPASAAAASSKQNPKATTWTPGPPMKVEHRVVWLRFLDRRPEEVAWAIDRETVDGWEFLSMSTDGTGRSELVFRRRVPVI